LGAQEQREAEGWWCWQCHHGGTCLGNPSHLLEAVEVFMTWFCVGIVLPCVTEIAGRKITRTTKLTCFLIIRDRQEAGVQAKGSALYFQDVEGSAGWLGQLHG